MGTTAVPKAWDGCNEILLGVGMTTNTVTHCCEQLDVAYSWDCCEMLQFFPLFLPFHNILHTFGYVGDFFTII